MNDGVNTSLGSRPSPLFAHFNCVGEREHEKPSVGRCLEEWHSITLISTCLFFIWQKAAGIGKMTHCMLC